MNLPTERFDEAAKQQEAEKAKSLKQGDLTGGNVGKQQSAVAPQESGTGRPENHPSGPSYSQVVASTSQASDTTSGGDGGGQSGTIGGNQPQKPQDFQKIPEEEEGQGGSNPAGDINPRGSYNHPE